MIPQIHRWRYLTDSQPFGGLHGIQPLYPLTFSSIGGNQTFVTVSGRWHSGELSYWGSAQPYLAFAVSSFKTLRIAD